MWDTVLWLAANRRPTRHEASEVRAETAADVAFALDRYEGPTVSAGLEEKRAGRAPTDKESNAPPLTNMPPFPFPLIRQRSRVAVCLITCCRV